MILKVTDASRSLELVCQASLNEPVLIQQADGTLFRLHPLPEGLSEGDLRAAYEEDSEWETFENHCAIVSE